MNTPKITPFNTLSTLDLQYYNSYIPNAFDESLTILEKVNKMLEYLNRVGIATNDVIENWNSVSEWLMSDGLNTSINNKVDDLAANGFFEPLVDDAVLNKTEKVINSSGFDTLMDAVQYMNQPETIETTLIIDKDYTVNENYIITKDNVKIRGGRTNTITRTDVNVPIFTFKGKNNSISDMTLNSPAQWNGENRKWLDHETVVLITGESFSAYRNTLNNVYKVGFGYRGTGANHQFIGNRIFGNYPTSQWTQVETAHFGIQIDGGKRILISENFIDKCVQLVNMGNYEARTSEQIIITDNFFTNSLDHSVYAGSGNTYTSITNNMNYNCRTSLALTGEGHVMSNNIMIYDSKAYAGIGGTQVSLRDPVNVSVDSNVIRSSNADKNSGIAINVQTLLTDRIDNVSITNNVIDNNALAPCIRVIAGKNTDTVNRVNISNNIIKGGAAANFGLIVFAAASNVHGESNTIKSNNITVIDGENSSYGITINNHKNILVTDNTIRIMFNKTSSTVFRGIYLTNTLYSDISNNRFINNGYGENLNMLFIFDGNSSKNVFNHNKIFNSTTNNITMFYLSNSDTNHFSKNITSIDDVTKGKISISNAMSYQITNKNVNTTTSVIITPTNSVAADINYYIVVQNGAFWLYLKSNPLTEATFNYEVI